MQHYDAFVYYYRNKYTAVVRHAYYDTQCYILLLIILLFLRIPRVVSVIIIRLIIKILTVFIPERTDVRGYNIKNSRPEFLQTLVRLRF